MSEILILRHAKAEPQALSGLDRERELSVVGRGQATIMGRKIAERRMIPEIVLASDSTRTRQTVDLLLADWEQTIEVVYSSELYSGGPDTYLGRVAATSSSLSRVLLVGHNPTVEELAQLASGRVISMGTGCLAVVETESLAQLSVDSPMSLIEVLEASP